MNSTVLAERLGSAEAPASEGRNEGSRCVTAGQKPLGTRARLRARKRGSVVADPL